MNFIKNFYRSHPIISAFILIIFTGLVLVWFGMVFLGFWTHHGSVTTVPAIKGLSFTEARYRLEQADLQIQISDSLYDRNTAPGTVIESWPKAGAEVKPGRPVYVSITAFSPKMVTLTMPVTGVSSRQAMSYLQALGINSIRIVKVPSSYSDLVISATVGSDELFVGATLPVNSTVTLHVGSGVAEPSPEEALEDSINSNIEELVTEESQI